MGLIQNLRDKLGNIIYPITYTNAVFRKDGKSNIETSLTDLEAKTAKLNNDFNGLNNDFANLTKISIEPYTEADFTYIEANGFFIMNGVKFSGKTLMGFLGYYTSANNVALAATYRDGSIRVAAPTGANTKFKLSMIFLIPS